MDNNSQNQQDSGFPLHPSSSYSIIGSANQQQKKKEKRAYTKRETIGAVCLFFLSFLLCRSAPFYKFPLGNAVVCTLALILATASLSIKKPAQKNMSALPFFVFCVLLDLSMLFSSNAYLQFFSYAAFILCLILFLYFQRSNGTGKAEAQYLFFDAARVIYRVPASSGASGIGAMLYPLKNGRFRSVGVNLKYILLGLVAALIPTAIVLSDLSFDSKFTSLLDEIFSFGEDGRLFSYAISALIALPVSCYFFSMATGIADKETIDQEKEKLRESYDASKVKLRIIPSLSILTAALPLVFLYVVFFISQIEEYTSAFTGVLPEGFIYSDYARSGFFELCRVAALNAIVILVSSVCARRKNDRTSITVKLVAIILSLCSLVLIATALSKMLLYINAYGMTEKRVYVSLFMILMALGFILCIAAQFIPRIKMTWVSITLALLLLLIPAFSNTDGMIYSYNAQRYIDGTLDSFDYGTVWAHPDAALPALARIYESEQATPEDKKNIEGAAKIMKFNRLTEDKIYYFNLQRYNAKKALVEILDSAN